MEGGKLALGAVFGHGEAQDEYPLKFAHYNFDLVED